MSDKVWIPSAVRSKSGLRKQLHMPKGEPIKMETLEKIKKQPTGTSVQSHGKSVKVTKCLKKRATLAHTLKTLQKRQRRKI